MSRYYILGADREPTPVKVVSSSPWQSIAIAIGALASVATLYSVWDGKRRRRR